ncbi:MAG: PIG-L family deacetylase [bacterium]|nr:PIG-L family deacetylase [bacterium]
MKRIASIILLLFCLNQTTTAQTPSPYSTSAVVSYLKKLTNTGSVLYIAAHPDDENTRLISWLANEKNVRTGYLSLTRGDGGQNLIGSEQGIELGVIRTQELLAARSTDGGEQFFTRAYDFGYSKTPKETFEKWNHEEILGDVVFVIRKFRPTIIITRFATDGSGGHGHHTASAILAEEAFEAAADPKRFPEQLTYVAVWQAKRLFYNSAARFWNPTADMSNFIKQDVGGFNQNLGKNYGEIAAESRSMHRSQGFGSTKQRGEMFEYFKPIKGDTANLTNIFDRLDLGWKSQENGSKIGPLLADAIAAYKKENIKVCNDKLIQALSFFPTLNSYDKATKYNQIIRAIILVNSLYLEAVSDGSAIGAIGDSLKVKVFGLNRSQTPISIDKISLKEYGTKGGCKTIVQEFKNKEFLQNNTPFTNNLASVICKQIPPSEMNWLSHEIKENKFVIEQANIGNPYDLNSGYFVQFELRVQEKPITIYIALQYKWTDPEKGEHYRPFIITAPAYVNVLSNSLVFNDTLEKEVRLRIKAGKDKVNGILRAHFPSNWSVKFVESGALVQTETCELNFVLDRKMEEKEIVLLVKPPTKDNQGSLTFELEIGGKIYTHGIKEIKYDHIPIQTLFPVAELKLVKINVVRKRKKIGYIPGAGDEIPAALNQMGYEVTTINDNMIASGNLNDYEAIVLGVRAFNTNEKLSINKKKLMAYVELGGNLIVQYNTNSFAGPFKGDIGPYPFKITRERVTDEMAIPVFALPNHEVFNKPNKITEQDFDGWLQERSIYQAGEIDARYEMPLTMNDPGEKASNGALLIGKYGKGNFIYTGLVFFRELPAGVPGAYRLFVNLIELK